jgi:hypothetical protein
MRGTTTRQVTILSAVTSDSLIIAAVGFLEIQQVLRLLPEAVLLMAALVLDDLRALDDREQRSASGRVTKFSGEPLEDDVSTLHPVGGTA